jgi:D-glycero-alpha-D-manno-heptose-7-phosphate kinase
MVISQTPLRLEFTGGSDLPAFYRHQPGAIVNVTINKYTYILARHPHFPADERFFFAYDKVEKSDSLGKIKNNLIRETLKLNKIKELSFASFADLPSQTGLGSSGSFTVGLLNILYNMRGEKASPAILAERAFYIESELVKVKCGPQDQMAAAHGGLRLQEFFPDNMVKSTEITCFSKTQNMLEENLLLIYTGSNRSAGNFLDNLWKILDSSSKARNLMSKRVDLSHLMAKSISQNSLSTFGEMLDEDWKLKKEIAPIETNSFIDSIYNKAKKNGAVGGKLVGAGGSGFMLFFAPKKHHDKIKKSLKPLHVVDFKFTNQGSRIMN